MLDLTTVGQRFRLAQGGNGGFGNQHFKTSTNQAPRRSPRPAGQAIDDLAEAEADLMCRDAGLVGLPNAGKSTFLAAVTAASRRSPTILHHAASRARRRPHRRREFVIADIPGLIEGAPGVGIAIASSAMSTHARAAASGLRARNPGKAYKTVRGELVAYGRAGRQAEIVALSQADTIDADAARRRLAALKRAAGRAPLLLSAVTGEGVSRAAGADEGDRCRTHAVADSGAPATLVLPKLAAMFAYVAPPVLPDISPQGRSVASTSPIQAPEGSRRMTADLPHAGRCPAGQRGRRRAKPRLPKPGGPALERPRHTAASPSRSARRCCRSHHRAEARLAALAGRGYRRL